MRNTLAFVLAFALILTIVPAVSAAWDAPDVYLALDDADLIGNTFTDRANGYDGLIVTVTGGTPLVTGVPGIVNEAVLFEAAGDATGNNTINIQGWTPDVATNGLSFCANVNASNEPNSKTLFNLQDPNSALSISFSLDQDNSLFIVCGADCGTDYGYVQINTSSYLVADENNHVCAAYNGGTYNNASDIQIYINDVVVDYGVDLLDSDFLGAPVMSFTWPDSVFALGGIYDFANTSVVDELVGTMDEVYIYNGILDASGVSSLYELTNTNGSQLLPLAPSVDLSYGLVRHYAFDNSSNPVQELISGQDGVSYATWTTDGMNGTGGLSFFNNGENATISVASDIAFTVNDSFTMSFNAKTECVPLDPGIFPTQAYECYFFGYGSTLAGSNFQWVSGSGLTSNETFVDIGDVNDGNYYYEVMFLNDTTDGNWHQYIVNYNSINLSVVIDGVEYPITTDADSNLIANFLDLANSDIVLGNAQDVANNDAPLRGVMDNFCIWNRSLSETEMNGLGTQYGCDGTVIVPVPPVTLFPVSGLDVYNSVTSGVYPGWPVEVFYTGGGGADEFSWFVNGVLIVESEGLTYVNWFGESGNYPEYGYVVGDNITVQLTPGNGTDSDPPINYTVQVSTPPTPVLEIGWDGQTYNKSNTVLQANVSDAYSCRLFVDGNNLGLFNSNVFALSGWDWYASYIGGEGGLSGYPDLENAYDDNTHNISMECYIDNRDSLFLSNPYVASGIVYLEGPVVPPTITSAELRATPFLNSAPLFEGYNARAYYVLDLAETDASTFRWFVNDVENFNAIAGFALPNDTLPRTQFVEGDNITVEITPATVESGAGTPVNYSAIVQGLPDPLLVQYWDGQTYNATTMSLVIDINNTRECKLYVDAGEVASFSTDALANPTYSWDIIQQAYGGTPPAGLLSAIDDDYHNISITCYQAPYDGFPVSTSGIAFLSTPIVITNRTVDFTSACAQVYPNELDQPSPAQFVYYTNITTNVPWTGNYSFDATLGAKTENCTTTLSNASEVRYSCTVQMNFYESSGNYVTSLYVNDTESDAEPSNITQFSDTVTCNYGELAAYQQTGSTLTFPGATSGSVNVRSLENVTVRNTGNVALNISTVAANLAGRTLPAVVLNANNFKMGQNLTSSVALSHNTGIIVTSLVPGANSQANLGVWLSVPAAQYVQDYYSNTAWQLIGE